MDKLDIIRQVQNDAYWSGVKGETRDNFDTKAKLALEMMEGIRIFDNGHDLIDYLGGGDEDLSNDTSII